MNEMDRKAKITLEDLLQIKRAERPPAEFWTQFEQELRAKQLAAIVETRPWWRSLVGRKALVRLCVPLGAAAVIAMTFSPFRVADLRQPSTDHATKDQAMVQIKPAKAESVAVTQENAIRPVESEVVASAVESMSQVNTTESQPTSEEARPAAGAPASATSVAQILASSFASVKVAGQALVQLEGLVENVNSQSGRAHGTVVEPLTQVATPRDNRRVRLLAYSVAFDPHAADSSDAVRSRERITRRMSDDAIYDSISRLGVSGDRVSIKF